MVHNWKFRQDPAHTQKPLYWHQVIPLFILLSHHKIRIFLLIYQSGISAHFSSRMGSFFKSVLPSKICRENLPVTCLKWARPLAILLQTSNYSKQLRRSVSLQNVFKTRYFSVLSWKIHNCGFVMEQRLALVRHSLVKKNKAQNLFADPHIVPSILSIYVECRRVNQTPEIVFACTHLLYGKLELVKSHLRSLINSGCGHQRIWRDYRKKSKSVVFIGRYRKVCFLRSSERRK